jgi:hypothetical protein
VEGPIDEQINSFTFLVGLTTFFQQQCICNKRNSHFLLSMGKFVISFLLKQFIKSSLYSLKCKISLINQNAPRNLYLCPVQKGMLSKKCKAVYYVAKNVLQDSL